MFKYEGYYRGIFIDNDIKALRIRTQALLGTKISGSIIAIWPDGKIAADELSFTIDVAREMSGKRIT